MTWTSADRRDITIAQGVILWIETARAAGYAQDSWLPSEADISKSALFERIRSGKEPLEFPPPRGMSCPWYAVVEDPSPQFVGRAEDGFGPYFGAAGDLCGAGFVLIMQSRFEIVTGISDTDMTVMDAGHSPQTPYRFRLWFDADWMHPAKPKGWTPGGWFLQNVEHIKHGR